MLTHREKPCNYFYWTLFVAYYINSNDDIFIDVVINIIAILISLSMITGKCLLRPSSEAFKSGLSAIKFTLAAIMASDGHFTGT